MDYIAANESMKNRIKTLNNSNPGDGYSNAVNIETIFKYVYSVTIKQEPLGLEKVDCPTPNEYDSV